MFVSRAGKQNIAAGTVGGESDGEDGGGSGSATVGEAHAAAAPLEQAETLVAVAGLVETEAIVEALEAVLLDGVAGAADDTTVNNGSAPPPKPTNDTPAAAGAASASPAQKRKQSTGTKIKNLLSHKGVSSRVSTSMIYLLLPHFYFVFPDLSLVCALVLACLCGLFDSYTF